MFENTKSFGSSESSAVVPSILVEAINAITEMHEVERPLPMLLCRRGMAERRQPRMTALQSIFLELVVAVLGFDRLEIENVVGLKDPHRLTPVQFVRFGRRHV